MQLIYLLMLVYSIFFYADSQETYSRLYYITFKIQLKFQCW